MFNLSALVSTSATGPRSILRLLHLLGWLGAHPEGQTLAQLCGSLEQPKTTLFTMLKVLERAEYVRLLGGLYSLGPAAVALGSSMAENPQRNFPNCARGVLENLSQRTGETGFLAVLTPDRQFCQYVAVVETDNWLRFSVKLGSQKPAYATGSGRAMLAYLPDSELQPLLNRFSFDRLTAKTVSSRRAMLSSLKEVLKHGVSTVDGGTVAGVVSVAAPIFGANAQVVAAVSAGGPTARLTERLPLVQRAVRDSAQEISRILGYRGVWPVN